jgi:hypothetical protein
MRIFIAIALAWLLAIAGPSSAQMTLTGAGSVKAPQASATKAYVSQGLQSIGIGASGATVTFSQSLGSSAGVVLIFLRAGGSNAVTSAVIDPTGANIALTSAGAPDTNNGFEYFFYATISGGLGTKNITFTFAGNMQFQTVGIQTWTMTGLSSPTPVAYEGIVDAHHTAINVASGNFLFCGFDFTAGSAFVGSTSLPNNIYLTDSNSFIAAADWSTPTPATPFTVQPLSGATTLPIAVTFN